MCFAIDITLKMMNVEQFELWYSRLVCLLITLIGLFGNLFIIIYFIKINYGKLQRMSSYHFLLIQLAILDFLVSVFFPISLYIGTYQILEMDSLECLISKFIYFILPLMFCWVLVLLSYERYRSLAHPFRPKVNKRIYLSHSDI